MFKQGVRKRRQDRILSTSLDESQASFAIDNDNTRVYSSKEVVDNDIERAIDEVLINTLEDGVFMLAEGVDTEVECSTKLHRKERKSPTFEKLLKGVGIFLLLLFSVGFLVLGIWFIMILV